MNPQDKQNLKALPRFVQDAALRAFRGSVIDLRMLNEIISSHEALPWDYRLTSALLPVFHAHLVSSRVPKGTTPDTVDAISRAKESLSALFHVCALYTRNGALNKEVVADAALVSKWADLLPWLQFFYRSFLAHPTSLPNGMQSFFVSAFDDMETVINILVTMCRYSGPGCPIMKSSPPTLKLIIQLWSLLADLVVPPGSLDTLSQLIGSFRVSLSMIMVVSVEAPQEQSIIPALVEAGGGVPRIVTTTLRYMRLIAKDVNKLAVPETRVAFDNAILIAWGISHCLKFMQLTSQADPAFREEFIARRSVRSVLTAIEFARPKLLVDSTENSDIALVRQQIFMIAYRYITFAMMFANDGISALCEALGARVLETMLQTGTFLSEEQDHARFEDGDVGFFVLLPRFFMWERVLRVLSKALDRISSRGTERYARRDAKLWVVWCDFTAILEWYLKKREDICQLRSPLFDCVCAGLECDDSPDGAQYRCIGCLLVRYCSGECQRDHWKDKHRKICKILRLAIGHAGSRDIRHSLPIIAALETEEWADNRAVFEELAAAADPASTGEQLVLELDLGQYPIASRVFTFARYSEIWDFAGSGKEALWEEAVEAARDVEGLRRCPRMVTVVKVHLGGAPQVLFSPSTALRLAFDWPV